MTSKKAFERAASTSAVDQVMNIILEGDGRDLEDIDAKLYAQAVKEGLAKRFSFTINKLDEDMAEEGWPSFYATIYPTEEDATFKCPSFIRPMVPDAKGVDECMETEWYFKTAKTPAAVAKQLSDLGFVWDKKAQWQFARGAYKAVKDALEGTAVPTRKPKP